MKFRSRRVVLVAASTLAGYVLGVGIVRAQAQAEQTPRLAEDVFVNVPALGGLPVDEFMDTMGMFSASLRHDLHRLPCRGKPQRSTRLWRRNNSEADFARHGSDGKRHQQGQFRRTTLCELLHLPSRRPQPEGRAQSGSAVQRTPGRSQ